MAQGGWSPPPGGNPPPPGAYGPPPGGYPPAGGYPPPGGQPPPGGFAPPSPAQAPPPAATPAWGGSPAPSPQNKGFIKGLFDFSFETFVALKVMRFLYGLFLILWGLGVLGGIGSALSSMFNDQLLVGFGLLIFLPFGSAISLILGRVYFELIIVAFKIAEDADEIARNTRK